MRFEYIWIDFNGNTRSKTRIIRSNNILNNDDLISVIPEWNFDGSSTGQATSDNSEVIIKPCAVFNDPFVSDSNSKLVL